MKVPIDDYACLELDAPVLPAYETFVSGSVDWLAWYDLERMAPNMCFTSKEIRGEITRIVFKIIGPVLREEIAKLEAEGKEAIFAGILVGSEPSIDDYSEPNPERTRMMREDGVSAGPLGYRALLDRGFRADNPPDDFRQALAKIIHETIAFWCKQFVDAGIPAEKLYPHVAAPAPIEMINAPIWTAFNEYSRPGWTKRLRCWARPRTRPASMVRSDCRRRRPGGESMGYKRMSTRVRGTTDWQRQDGNGGDRVCGRNREARGHHELAR